MWEFSKFLLEVAEVEDVGARLEDVVTFHDSCHGLRELGIKDGPRRLLAHVRGLELREMDLAEECCGFGGTFSVKFPELSGGMARTKIESIARTGRAHGGGRRRQLPACRSRVRSRARDCRCAPCTWPKCWPAGNRMSAEFDEKIRKTLADGNLQAAVYAATGGWQKRRETWWGRRRCRNTRSCATQAHAIKKHTLENLDHYLQQFEANVVAHGGKVVWCKDGAEVAEFVLGPGEGARRAR